MQAHYCKMLLGLASEPEECEKIRAEMMPAALADFDWEHGVDSHEELMRVRQSGREGIYERATDIDFEDAAKEPLISTR
jgi:hypothetical protein